MAKQKRSDIAVRGTRSDSSAKNMRDKAGSTVDASAPMSSRERLTARMVLTANIVLAIIPFVYLATAGVLTGGASAMQNLRSMMEGHPAFLIMFLSACLQPFVAYLIHIAYKHYRRDDGAYAVANLIVLLCSEMIMQNMVGIVAMAVLLWRFWRRGSAQLSSWSKERRLGGILFDISGALVVLALAILCAFANWRISA